MQHGDHFSGMLIKAKAATMKKFVDEPLYAFTKDGYQGAVYAVEEAVEDFLTNLHD